MGEAPPASCWIRRVTLHARPVTDMLEPRRLLFSRLRNRARPLSRSREPRPARRCTRSRLAATGPARRSALHRHRMAGRGAAAPRFPAHERDARRRGVHGLGGSARAARRRRPRPEPTTRCVLVHVLNPYGMAWLRRTNENNVDLNRNFLRERRSVVSGAPALYRAARSAAQSALSARARRLSRARRGDGRALRLSPRQAGDRGRAVRISDAGFSSAARELQPGPRALRRMAARAPRRARLCVRARPAHRSRPPRHRHASCLERGVAATSPPRSRRALGRALVDAARPSVAYTVRGSFGAALPHCAPGRAHRFRAAGDRHLSAAARPARAARGKPLAFFRRRQHSAPAKARLREALCPAAEMWRRQAVARGLARARGPLRDGLSARGRCHELRAVRAHRRRAAVAGRALPRRARGRARLSRLSAA